MPEIGAYEPLSFDEYAEAKDALHIVNGAVLFEFAREPRGVRDTIIRNFVARTEMLITAVFALWDLGDYQDCWILHRCLMDRFFHLVSLGETDSFDDFEEWSFLRQYTALNRVLTDPMVAQASKARVAAPSAEQKRRARALQNAQPSWRRPRAEDVATRLDMHFLYRVGYDYASTHVHPMADDGLQDFHTITGLEPAPDFPDQSTVLSNTLLVATMMVQEGLNASTMLWRALVYNVIDDLRAFLGTGSRAYTSRLLALVHESTNGTRLSESMSASNEPGGVT